MLAMHPEYQEKVYEEIENILPDGQTTVTADVVSQLIHTDRLLKETLRLFPVIPLITRITRKDKKIGRHIQHSLNTNGGYRKPRSNQKFC